MSTNPLRAARETMDEIDMAAEKEGDKYKLTIYTTEAQAAMAVEVIHMLMGISERMLHTIKNVKSLEQAQAAKASLLGKHQALRDRYHILRDRGYGHRSAAEFIFNHDDLARQLNYTASDIARLVKNETTTFPARKETTHETECPL